MEDDGPVKDDVLGRFRALLLLRAESVAVAFADGLIGGDQGRLVLPSVLSSTCSSPARWSSFPAVMLA